MLHICTGKPCMPWGKAYYSSHWSLVMPNSFIDLKSLLVKAMGCVLKLVITWTNVDLLSVGPFGTNSNNIFIKIRIFSQENNVTIENVVCKMLAILFRSQWMTWLNPLSLSFLCQRLHKELSRKRIFWNEITQSMRELPWYMVQYILYSEFLK